MLLAVTLTACTDEPAADRIAGSYGCHARLDTRYQKNGQWRDTSYITTTNNTVTITKLDDTHVAIQASSKKWGDVTVEQAEVIDYNYEANIGGDGIYVNSNHSYNTSVSGTVSYENRAMTISFRVTDYPYSGGKYILTLYNIVN
jgi:hypothetical protein